MHTAVAIIESVLPVILALALGMLCRSKQILSREGIDSLKKVAVNLTLPFVLLSAFATAEYSAAALLMPSATFILCCIALALGFFIIRLLKIKSRTAPFLASGFEAGMLGYALFALLFPKESVSHFALLDIGQTLFVFTLFKILLTGKANVKAICRDMATTPILWAVAAGVLIGASGLYQQMHTWGIGGIFDSVTAFLSAPTAMLILLTVGYDLVLKEIPWKKTSGFVVMRLVVMVLFYAALILLNRTVLNGMIFEGAALLLVILPPPYVIPVFADEPEERVQTSSALSVMTLITILLFAAIAVISAVN